MRSADRVKFVTGKQQLVKGEGKPEEEIEERESERGRAEESKVAWEDALSRSAKQRMEGELEGDFRK